MLAKVPTKKIYFQVVLIFRTKDTEAFYPISKKELSSLVNSLRDFLKAFDKTSNCLQIPLPKTKTETASTNSKGNLFAHYYNDTTENPNRQVCLSFRFGNNNSCVFSIKKFEPHGNQLLLTKFFNLNHQECHYLYKNRFYVANKCEINENNYDVSRIHP